MRSQNIRCLVFGRVKTKAIKHSSLLVLARHGVGGDFLQQRDVIATHLFVARQQLEHLVLCPHALGVLLEVLVHASAR